MEAPAPGLAARQLGLLPKRVLTIALSADIVLVVSLRAYGASADRTPAAKPLIFLFDLNGEGNVPAWFSGMQLLLIGLAFFALALWFFQSDERVAPLRDSFLVGGWVSRTCRPTRSARSTRTSRSCCSRGIG